ncbi:MAG: tetratricopeptide repeat protein [Planctomycetota bacterium]
MSKDQLRIPTFKSLEEFSIWWKSPEVVRFCKNNPDKVSRLQEHHLVKPWLEQLKPKSTPSVHSSPPEADPRLTAVGQVPQAQGRPKGLSSDQTQSKTFGKYILEKKLGQGGMGVVYLVSDPALQRQVALKIMLLEDKEMIERFTREAQAMAKLKHPNIIQVYEVGNLNKHHYFTMEYIKGASLEELIKDKKNKLSLKQVAEIIRDTASALDYAHKQGIIHRDIKPANIVIDSNRHPYLMDFGLAKELTGLDRSLTMSGSIMGTPEYMSPEQAMGDKKKIDSRSDIFSLGSTLYHCLTGLPPFRGKELYQILNQVVNKDPIPPSRLINRLPKDLETICLKCIDKEKTRRYQTSKALAEDINRYLKGESISAKPTGLITKILKKAGKNKLASFSIVGTAVILTGLIIGLSVSSANKKQKIEEFSKEAYAEFNKEKYNETVAFCNKLLALSPEDEEIKSLLRKSQYVIKEREDKTRAENEAEKANADKLQKDKEKRDRAKGILDRINAGNLPPDDRIKAAEEALKIDPDYGDAYQVMGYAYKDKNDYDKAYDYFSKAIKKTPTLAYSYYERAMITAYKWNKPEEAIPDFEKVLQYDPKSHIGYFAKGTIKYYQEDYDSAITDYTEAIKLKPKYVESYNNRGIAYKDKGELDKAIADYNEAIRLDPKYADAYCNRGSVYKDKGELDKAISDFNEAINLDPKYAGAYSNRGNAYNLKGELDKAIADYTEAITLDPKFAMAYYNRGNVYFAKGELEKAIADYNEAIRLDPKSAAGYCNRGYAYAQKGELDKAIADYNEAITLDPKYAIAYGNRGTAYAQKGELDKAIADFNEAITLDPKYAMAYGDRGTAYKLKGELDKAIVDYNKAITLNQKYAEAYSNRGSAYSKKGELDKAIADYNEAIRLNPKLAEAYYNRGNAYARKGEFDKAIAEGEMFLKLAPNHPNAPEMRDLIEQCKKELQNK